MATLQKIMERLPMTPLKHLRNTRKLSIHAVAEAVGTNPGNMSRIENGKQRASPGLAEKIAKYFGYAITEIQILYPERFDQSSHLKSGNK